MARKPSARPASGVGLDGNDHPRRPLQPLLGVWRPPLGDLDGIRHFGMWVLTWWRGATYSFIQIGRERPHRLSEAGPDDEAQTTEEADRAKRPRRLRSQDRLLAAPLDISFDALEGPAVSRVILVSDCDNLCQWAKGTWKMFSPRLSEPLQRILDTVDAIRRGEDSLGGPTTGSSMWRGSRIGRRTSWLDQGRIVATSWCSSLGRVVFRSSATVAFRMAQERGVDG